MAHDTRDVLLATGTTLFLERGYAATGLQDILQHSRIPKGSFYHHFQSKEGFGLELLERFAAAGLAELDAALGDASVPTHLGRLRRYFECAGNHAAGEGCCRGGCSSWPGRRVRGPSWSRWPPPAPTSRYRATTAPPRPRWP